MIDRAYLSYATLETAETLFMERSQKTDWVDDMFPFGVQIQGRVHQRDCPADTVIPILASNLVQRPVDVGPALGFLYLREQGQLHNAIRRGQPAGLH